jgi:hypothetical protein
MQPGWVEFPPVWGSRPAKPTDGYSEETIAKVFQLAMAHLRGDVSEIETINKFVALRRAYGLR